MGRKYLSQINAQSSQAGTADTQVTAGQTVIDNITASTGNALECDTLDFELNVTSPPSTATTVDLYVSVSQDGSNYSDYVYVGTFTVSTSAAIVDGVSVKIRGPYMITAWTPIGYGLTAILNAMPVYHA